MMSRHTFCPQNKSLPLFLATLSFAMQGCGKRALPYFENMEETSSQVSNAATLSGCQSAELEANPPDFIKTLAQNTRSELHKYYFEDCGGARYYRIELKNPRKNINVAFFDLRKNRFQVRVSSYDERFKTPSQFARDLNLVAAINGDFWGGNHLFPMGLSIGSGQHWPDTRDSDREYFFACSRDNNCFVEGTSDAKGLHLDDKFPNVVSGRPLLVRDGKAMVSNCDAPIDHDLCRYPHPRSAVGLTENNEIILIVVEGRIEEVGPGVTFVDMATIAQALGAKNSVGLDGGGSSGLFFNGSLRNKRPDNEKNERAVPNLLGIYDNGAPSVDDETHPANAKRGWHALLGERDHELRSCLSTLVGPKFAEEGLRFYQNKGAFPDNRNALGHEVCNRLGYTKCLNIYDWQCTSLGCADTVEPSRMVECQ